MTRESHWDRDAVNKIFGNPLPNITRDEQEEARPADDGERDRWLRDNVPPHHA